MKEKTTSSGNILVFSSAYLPAIGGAELALKEITDRLPDIQFDLITPRFRSDLPSQETIGNINVYRVGSRFSGFKLLLPKAFFPIFGFFKARQLMRQRGSYYAFFALQASQGAGAAWLLKLLSYPRIPFIVNVQEGKELQRQHWLAQLLRETILKKADQVTVISRYLRDTVMKIGIPSSKIMIIPNGVDVANFSRVIAPEVQNTLRQRLGIVEGEKVIITASRLVHKNAVDDLIRALLYIQKYAIKLIVAGDGVDRQALERLTIDLGLTDKVVFVGSVSHQELPEYFSVADVFVRPSRSEGLGNAFLEAMAARLPVVGTSVGGIPDFLEDGITGLFARPNNPESIAEAVTRIFDDPELRQKLIKNALILVAKDYDWNLIADKYHEVFLCKRYLS